MLTFFTSFSADTITSGNVYFCTDGMYLMYNSGTAVTWGQSHLIWYRIILWSLANKILKYRTYHTYCRIAYGFTFFTLEFLRYKKYFLNFTFGCTF
jgi:hypothetical protein